MSHSTEQQSSDHVNATKGNDEEKIRKDCLVDALSFFSLEKCLLKAINLKESFDEGSHDSLPRAINKVPGEKKKPPNGHYDVDDDIILCRAWLGTSHNPIVGNNQKGDSYWGRITFAYNRQFLDPSNHRTCKQLKCHWGRIQKMTREFCAIYNRCSETWTNKNSDGDIFNKAMTEFKQTNETPYKYPHCWELLRNTPKFQKIVSDHVGYHYETNKRGKNNAGERFTSVSTQSDHRPSGTKVEKGNEKNKELEQSEEMINVFSRCLNALEDIASLNRRKFEYKLLMKDTSTMTPDQYEAHMVMLAEIKSKGSK